METNYVYYTILIDKDLNYKYSRNQYGTIELQYLRVTFNNYQPTIYALKPGIYYGIAADSTEAITIRNTKKHVLTSNNIFPYIISTIYANNAIIVLS